MYGLTLALYYYYLTHLLCYQVCNTCLSCVGGSKCLTSIGHGHVSEIEVFLLLSTTFQDSQFPSLEILIYLISMPLLDFGSNFP